MTRCLRVILIPLCYSCVGCDIFTFFPWTDPSLTVALLRWNQIAIDTSGLDHAPVKDGESRVFGHQLGPTRASRAMAIVHIAMFDAVNAVTGQGYQGYTDLSPAPLSTSIRAAVAQAAHDTLLAMYPSHAARLNALLQEDLVMVADSTARQSGAALGMQAAAAILTLRENDGSDNNAPYIFSNSPGKWRADPINPDQKPLGENWHHVKPFVMDSASQFRCPVPPALTSDEYAVAYNEVKAIGGDGVVTPSTRNAGQTHIGLYWAYDGTPSLCAPPRLYNQITTQLAVEQGVGGVELARLMALVNVAMADAGIAIWESKYYYNYWRPVTGIRESDPGNGPTGLGDGNANTIGDPTYIPLCAPASNLAGPNFTPPFPAYPSGHAGFGGALFEVLREFFDTDNIAFTFVSDEYNGVTVDNQGNVRPLLPRTFSSLTQAETENGESRIFLGIHWRFDMTEGIILGNKVGAHVLSGAFQPR